ncbi:DUF1566 domain-containing protein [Marinobacter sp. Hex_13]|uniref:Lcl C-terminal domain-containing protein n=1 Tax=Marinobacter sp. Hex_13 TaxID=1795866 RepID=UPI0007929A3A|nr:DUF1566 domain-containing protein [Marinobacter sp. Hex_13]KXJ45856.1 MAG: hypothetical protein AXW11_12255 [Marinobacter sp. Hex_13]
MQRFIDHSVVTDTKTGLQWTKATVAEDVTFEKAQEAVEALGKGWRLPTVDELFSLVDHSKHEPAIDSDAFPDTKNDCYWTSTPCAWNDTAVWVVYFDDGGVYHGHRSSYACVRAVRSGQ